MVQHPSKVLILPIMSLDEVLSYRKGAFSIEVLGAGPDTYKGIGLTSNFGDECTVKELKMAYKTLRAFTFAVAYHRQHNFTIGDIERKSLYRAENLKVLVPKRKKKTAKVANEKDFPRI